MSNSTTSIPLGVCVLGEAALNAARTVSYPNYVFEILAHAGVFHTRIDSNGLESQLDSLRVLVTIGEGQLDDSLRQQLENWVNAGGMWLSVSGLAGLESLLGVSRSQSSYKNWAGGLRSLGEGYLVPTDDKHPMLAHLNRPLHYFGGATVEAKGATVLATANDAHGRPTGHPVLLERAAGKGKCVLIAPDLTGTVVYIQQGHGVTRDGVPAPDGTSPVNDGVLKSDDGAVLDWILDREPVEGAEGLSIFVQPVADLWRELLLRGIFYLASAADASRLPVLWYWPRQLPAVGHLSHDTDGNDPKLCQRLLDTLAAGEVNSTWCVILPGYDQNLMGKIKSAGHEYAMHYDAMSPGLPFCEEQFDRQFKELKTLFGEQPVTNKNHYLRWEGDTELWDWCLKHGIELDQSKGTQQRPAKRGSISGTCHTYFPVRFDGSTIDVLRIADAGRKAPIRLLRTRSDSRAAADTSEEKPRHTPPAFPSRTLR